MLLSEIYVVATFFYYLIFGPITFYFFTQAGRLRRELQLRRLLRESAASPEEFLSRLQALAQERPEDSHLHYRYAEALLAQKRPLDAAVEATLILETDPYHFGANLLLAHAYLELGWLMQCRAVCMRYLSVSRQCFEFVELNERCLRLMGAAL